MLIKQIQIQQCHQRIKPYIHQTPLLQSKALNNKCGNNVWLKCQNMQKIGAFKPRGAFNKLLQLPPTIKSICTHSSGNHAQAIAYACKILNLNGYIVMPQNSPKIKQLAVEQYGAKIIKSGNTIKQRQDTLKQIQNQYQSYFVHPYDDRDIIIGQSTVAKEVFQSNQSFDYILFPIGGGGLAAGTLMATKYWGKACKTIGVQPYLARDAYDSLRLGKIQPQYPPISIADGLRTSLGVHPFIQQKEIIEAQKFVMERMKIIIESSSATVIAAVMKDQRFKGKKVCCIISGGNLDMSALFDTIKAKL